MLDAMLARRWRLFAFVSFFVCLVSHAGLAGPLPKEAVFCIPEARYLGFLGLQSPNLFAKSGSAQFRQSTNMLQLGGIDFTHVAAPPEFRLHDFEIKNASGQILPGQILQAPLWAPCRFRTLAGPI